MRMAENNLWKLRPDYDVGYNDLPEKYRQKTPPECYRRNSEQGFVYVISGTRRMNQMSNLKVSSGKNDLVLG